MNGSNLLLYKNPYSFLLRLPHLSHSSASKMSPRDHKPRIDIAQLAGLMVETALNGKSGSNFFAHQPSSPYNSRGILGIVHSNRRGIMVPREANAGKFFQAHDIYCHGSVLRHYRGKAVSSASNIQTDRYHSIGLLTC